MKTCKVVGCDKHASGYSTLCANHAKTKSRHGHPLQKAIRRHELKPFEKAVTKWLKERSGPDAWCVLLTRWEALVSEASIYCERPANKRPFQRDLLKASQTILDVHKDGKQREAIIRLLAIGYMFQWEPRRFQSDSAFHFQVARQFRTLTDTSVGQYWDNKAEKVKRVYRDVPPRTLRALWNLLCETGIPRYGQHIAVADMKERMRRKYKDSEATRAILGATAYDSLKGEQKGQTEYRQPVSAIPA